jgi:aspartate carbamoyltransferase catalytic subunit
MNAELSTQHLLGIKELTPEDIHLILNTATEFKAVLQRPIKKVPSLRDVTVANLFFENSTRTRLSFELAEKRLSADVINFSASGSSVAKGETLTDTVNNILAMRVDLLVLRHPTVGAAHFLARKLKEFPLSKHAKIINAGDGTNEHPTQALLDAFSIREKLGSIEGKRIALIGDILHSRVALSNIRCLLKLGAEVRLCAPPTLLPRNIHQLGVSISNNVDQTLEWCEVANVLRIQMERQERRFFPSLQEYHLHFGIDENRLLRLSKPIVIMHPGPVNRGVELNSTAADSPHSIILEQVENGVAVRMAILYLLAGKRG